MKKTIIFFLALFTSLCLYSHPWKPSHYVIIDTDGGIDDIRAITLLLASPDVRVLAITTSSGVLSAENAYLKVKSLLNSFHHEGLPVGINRMTGFQSQNFPAALQTKWGDENGLDPAKAPDFIQLIREIISFEKTKISFICLGGMTSASAAEEKISAFKTQVKEIIWNGNGLKDTKGFNFNIDKEASLKILNDNIPLRVVKGTGEEIFFDENIIGSISEIKTVCSQKIYGYFKSNLAKSHKYSYTANDEMIPLYIHYPQYFKTDSTNNNTPAEKQLLKEGICKILKGETVARNQVIKEIPLVPSFYFADIEPTVTEIIEKYGLDEWTSGVLANELHRHLGVFAIIGVKMGIRAREYFCTGVDEFSVTSFAGSIPPLSCMNDGIQVSTGATPGHGLLTVRSDTLTGPSAEFSYLNHKIRLTLKPEITGKISSELKEINFVYGLDSNIYWELVRKNSIKYWLNLNRYDIFVIEVIM